MKSITKTLVTTVQIHKIVNKHFPGSVITGTKELKGGLFNSAYLVEGEGELKEGIVIKIGPLPTTYTLTYEKEIMRTEVKVYELLADKAIPTPAVLAHDFSHSDIPCDYFIMQKLNGQTWSSAKRKRVFRDAHPDLMREFGRCNAAIHSVEGEWFGYVKDDERFQFDNWEEAFTAMVSDILADGLKRKQKLPFDEIKQAIIKHKNIFNEIEKPSLVSFDMWAGNVFVTQDNNVHISGVVDFERSFYGDPFADFTAAIMLFNDVEKEMEFQEGYSEISGKPFAVSANDRIRMDFYRLYMALIMSVETYRFNRVYAFLVEKYTRGQMKKLLRKLK